MDRNIITEADVVSFDGMRGADATESADDRFQKLLKFIPSESIGLYVGLDGVIRSAVSDTSRVRLWLSFVLIVCILFTWLYLTRLWHVKRLSQVAVSTVALVAYVFAIGGVFREFNFYQPWQSTVVLIIITAFLVFFTPPGPARAEVSLKGSRRRQSG
jgi:hypothetical protein